MKEIRDWLDVASKIVLAATAAIIGYYFSYNKQQNDDIKLIVEMVSDEDKGKKLLGSKIAQSYVKSERIPNEIYLSIYEFAQLSPDEKLRVAVTSGAEEASRGNSVLQTAIKRIDDRLPARIYFHIRDQSTEKRFANVEKELEAKTLEDGTAILVPFIEHIPGTQVQDELRCFKKAECEAYGAELVRLLNESSDGTLNVALKDFSAQYENSKNIRPRHFEAWFK